MDDATSQPAALQESPTKSPDDGRPVLCLSGGGFRATVFHLGVLRRLNEFGLLSRLGVITSVSGGSILNGFLATRWSQLAPRGAGHVFSNFEEVVEQPVEQFCQQDLRTPLLLFTRLNPANWAALLRDYCSVSANFLAQAYEPYIGGVLGDLPLPDENAPRFVFCATNVLTGACWHFHGGPGARMGDFYAGYCDAQAVKVSEAVAASSAFTPGFSALRLRLPSCCPMNRIDPWGEERPPTSKPDKGSAATTAVLTDGGVYDNMGVEPVWKWFKNLLVSEAGRPFAAVWSNRQLITSRLQRAMDISIEQVGAVRRRWLVDDFMAKRRHGAMWTIHTLIEDFPIHIQDGYGPSVRPLVSSIRTDLNAFSPDEIACLKNHGYSLADAAVRSHADELGARGGAPLDAPFRWPNKALMNEKKATAALTGSDARHILRDVGRLLMRWGKP